MEKWTPASEPPQIESGLMQAVVVARQSTKGTWYVFGAWFLQDYELAWETDGDVRACTGFFLSSKHYAYDDYYEPIDVLFWQPMPDAPGCFPPARF